MTQKEINKLAKKLEAFQLTRAKNKERFNHYAHTLLCNLRTGNNDQKQYSAIEAQKFIADYID